MLLEYFCDTDSKVILKENRSTDIQHLAPVRRIDPSTTDEATTVCVTFFVDGTTQTAAVRAERGISECFVSSVCLAV